MTKIVSNVLKELIQKAVSVAKLSTTKQIERNHIIDAMKKKLARKSIKRR
jgi:hypothetical protein